MIDVRYWKAEKEKTQKEEAEKTAYEKPLLEEQKGLTFTKEIWEKFNGDKFCLQCSGCHGCR